MQVVESVVLAMNHGAQNADKAAWLAYTILMPALKQVERQLFNR